MAQSAPSPAGAARPSSEPRSRTSERKAALRASRLKSLMLAGAMAFATPTPAQAAPQEPTEQVDGTQAKSQQDAQTLTQAQRIAGLRAAAQQRIAQQQAQQKESNRDDADQTQMIRRKAKAAMRRTVLGVINSIGAAIDIGSIGVTMIITGGMYLFTLAWFNLEMIYGLYFMKGKSKIIAPLSYEPIPMPIDKGAHILIAIVVAADIAFGLAIVLLGSFGACFIHDAVKFVNAPIAVGGAIAQGGGDLCLGAIIGAAL